MNLDIKNFGDVPWKRKWK